MKSKTALLGLIVVSLSVQGNAATLTWDSNAATAPNPYDGGGTWNLTGLNFWNGTANVAWNNTTNAADIAAFGTPPATLYQNAGVVGLGAATISLGGLQTNPYVAGPAGKYNINNGTLAFGSNAATITVNTVWSRPYMAINTTLTGSGGISVAGSGILEWGTGANTFTGGLNLGAGSTLSIDADARLGAAANVVNFNGSASLVVRTTNTYLHNTAIAPGVTGTLDVLNGVTATWGSATTGISGNGNLQKSGLGALTLVGSHLYQGETRLRQGTLTLDFGNAASPVTNIVNGGSTLVLGGGLFAVNGKTTAAVNAQSFNGTTLVPGASGMTMTLNAATSVTTNLGAITRQPGSTVNLAPIATNTFYNTTSGNTNGILGGFATVNGADWAAVSGGSLVPYAGYTTGTDATAWVATDNVSLTGTPAPALADNATINSLRVLATATVDIPVAKTLTLASGGLLVSGTSPATISGGTLKGSASGDLIVLQNSSGTTTISSVIADNGGTTALTKSGAGPLVLTGSNTYSGPTYLNNGGLEVTGDAALGTGATVISRVGTTLTLSGTSAIVSGKNFLFDFGSEGFGNNGLGMTATDVGSFNLNVVNPAGATLSGTFNVTAGTLVKTGAGTLTLTNPAGAKLGRLNGNGGCVNVLEGGLVLNGGSGAVYQVGQGELTVGTGDNATSAAAKAATVTLTGGAVVTGSWTSVGRGNGTTGLESKLIMTGGTWDCGSFGLGFANGVAGYNAKPRLELSNDAVLTVRDIFNCGESAGSDASATLSGNSQMLVRNRIAAGQAVGAKGTINLSGNAVMSSQTAYFGFGVGGTAVINVADSATLTCATDFNVGDTDNANATLNISGGTVKGLNFFVGKGSNQAATTLVTNGVVNQTGGSFSPTAAGGDWRMGGANVNDAQMYGSYAISGGTFDTTGHNFQVGAYGIGALDISGSATVTSSAGWPVIGRFAGSFGVMNLSGGSFTQASAGNGLLIGEVGNGTLNQTGGSLEIAGGTGLRISNGATGSGAVNLNGGTLTTTGVSMNGGAGRIYLNGGLLKAGPTANTAFMGGLTSALVGPAGARIDTNGKNITVSQSLAAAAGNGVSSITVGTGGAGYMGQPVVSITGGGGTGASAIATVVGGVVTGFVITNPGTGYTDVPTVTLYGGGATTAATGAAALGPVATDGGLVKSGAGILTLSGSNSYKGGTTVNNGTLALGGNEVLADTGALTITGADFDVGGFSDTVGAVTLNSGNLTGTGGSLTATSFAVGNTSGAATVSAGLSGTGVNLTKSGAGDLNLTGNNTYTGTTFLTGGGITALGATGSLDPASSLSITASTLDLRNGTASRLQSVANLTLDNATLVFGMTGLTTDALNATGTTATSGTTTIKIVGSATAGTYSVLTTAAPLTGTFALDTSGMLAGFTSYSGTVNGNTYQITAAGNLTPGSAYWKGDVSNLWSDSSQAASNNSNWATSAGGGTDTKQLPGGTTNVYFLASGAANTTTNLGASFSINSLTFESGSASVLGGANSLTILGVNPNNFPLEVQAGASAALNATTLYTGATNLQAGGTLTVNGGNLGAAADEIIVDGTFNVNSDVTKGILSGTGTITRSDVGTSTLTVGDVNSLTFAGNIQNAVGTLNLTKAGTGPMLLSGTANNFAGVLKIAGGSLAIDNPGALLNPAGVVQQNGTTFTNGAGTLTLACPYGFDLNGGVAVAVNQPALGGGLGNYLLDLGGGTTTVSGLVSNNGGSVVKRGGGTLAITNGGANVLAAAGGIAFALQEGDMVLDGGAAAAYTVNTGELAVGDNTPNPATLTLNSGTLTVGTYLSVGRGNGTAELQSTLNLNGGTLAVPNLFTGYANGIGGYNARPVINLNGATANVGAVRIGESAGCVATLNLTAGALTATGLVQIGFGGTGIATNNIPISVGSLQVGAATGVGAFYNNSTVTVTSAANVAHFPIGNGVGGYGYFRNNTGGTVVMQEVGIGGSTGGANTGGVLDVIGGAVTVNTWLTPNRGAAGESCLLNVTGGTFTTPNSGQAGANWSTNQYAHLEVSGTGALIGGGAAASLNLNQTSSADNTGLLTIGSGGTVQLTSILMAATAGNSIVNFNGGTLKAGAAAPALLAPSITGAYLHSGGAVIDTNTFDATVAEPLLAPTGSGVATIPLATTGAGYVGRPIVRIAGDGVGATAIANYDPATGEVSGITVTSPGSGYTTPPTITLIGGGGTTTAVAGTPTLAASNTTGGLVKNGDGTLTLSAVNTYVGNTTVAAGGLTLADDAQLKFVIGANGVNNSIGGTGTLTLNGDFVIDTSAADATAGNTWTLVNVGTLAESYGTSFSVVGFTGSAGEWTRSTGSGMWIFTQSDGVLKFVAGTPYSQWAAAKGLTAGVNDGKTQDPDMDGRTNFQEFAFDGDPLSGANDGKIVGKVATVAGGRTLTLTLPVRAGAVFSDDPTTHEEVSAPIDGVIYHIQGAANLAAWTENVTEVTGADAITIQSGMPLPLGAGWTYRTFRVPGTVSSQATDFIRAKVTE